MNKLETGPAGPLSFCKKINDETATPVVIKTYSLKPKVKMSQLRRMVKSMCGDGLSDFEETPVFYRQKLNGKNYEEVIREFHTLAANPDCSVLHHRIDISQSVTVKPEQWYELIRFFLSHSSQLDAPVAVFNTPTSSQRIDLILLEQRAFGAPKYTSYERWIINQMISIRLGFRLIKLNSAIQAIAPYPNCLTPEKDYISYISQAIQTSLLTHQLGTIHDFKNWLDDRYGIEVSFQSIDHYFQKLRFRCKHLIWIKAEALTFNSQNIRVVLEFNRIVKAQPGIC